MARGGRPRHRKHAPVVLVVDDIDDNREMYVEFLEYCGYETVEAGTGVQALDVARQIRPDVIVTDLALPEMDGWESIRRLKGDETTKRIPIIVVTAHVLLGVEKSARDAGADIFLTKPCLPRDLAATVASTLGRGIQARSA